MPHSNHVKRILIPKQRQARLLHLLDLDGEQVKEIVLLPDGGLVTKYRQDSEGNLIRNAADTDWEEEMVEIEFVDRKVDPQAASNRYQG